MREWTEGQAVLSERLRGDMTLAIEVVVTLALPAITALADVAGSAAMAPQAMGFRVVKALVFRMGHRLKVSRIAAGTVGALVV